MYQVLKGVSALHTNRAMHRDIKPKNILLNHNFEAKVADFGLSRTSDYSANPLTPDVVSLWYRAPELLCGFTHYTSAIDIWSLGCVFYELITNTPLFKGEGDFDMLNRIFCLIGSPTRKDWPDYFNQATKHFQTPFYSKRPYKSLFPEGGVDPLFLDLLEKMIQCNPSMRITAKAALSHPFFEGIGEEATLNTTH